MPGGAASSGQAPRTGPPAGPEGAGRPRLTRLGAVLLALLALSLLALFLGSPTLQAIGFVVALVIALLLAAEGLPRMRLFGRRPWELPGPPPSDAQPGARRGGR